MRKLLTAFKLIVDLRDKGQPGPGTYEPKPAINDKGNYFISKFKSSGATSIDPPTSTRFKDFSCKFVSL